MDQKYRWGGLLENPVISKIQRDMLDFGRTRGLGKMLSRHSFNSVLDIGCGLGETSTLFECSYVGIDNSAPRVKYAMKKYPARDFRIVDAGTLPFSDRQFDATIMIDTSHHLSDEVFLNVLKEMARVSMRYLIISDPVYFNGQYSISKYFYGLDRGGCIRTSDQMKAIFAAIDVLELEFCDSFITFPGLYRHAVFILRVKSV